MKIDVITTNKTKNKIVLKNIKMLAERVARKVLKTDLIFLSITFVGSKLIKKINKQAFDREHVTDVISLEIGSGKEISGDIYICVEVANKNAKKYGVSLDEELKRLVIHGVLHSSGMEHEETKGRPKMIVLQEKLLKEFENLKTV